MPSCPRARIEERACSRQLYCFCATDAISDSAYRALIASLSLINAALAQPAYPVQPPLAGLLAASRSYAGCLCNQLLVVIDRLAPILVLLIGIIQPGVQQPESRKLAGYCWYAESDSYCCLAHVANTLTCTQRKIQTAKRAPAPAVTSRRPTFPVQATPSDGPPETAEQCTAIPKGRACSTVNPTAAQCSACSWNKRHSKADAPLPVAMLYPCFSHNCKQPFRVLVNLGVPSIHIRSPFTSQPSRLAIISRSFGSLTFTPAA